MSQEKRKHPRYDTDLDIIFYDSKRTKGKLINISKKGCLITTASGIMRPIDAMVTFRVFFSGKAALSENTMPNISLAELTKAPAQPKPSEDPYPNAVKIISRVARHVTYQDKPAMGIELLNLDGNDLIKWNNYVAKVSKEQIVLPYVGPESPPPPPKSTTKPNNYVIRFKAIQHAIQYLPRDAKTSFFVPSPVEVKKGFTVKLTMVHPENQSKLHFNAIVENYGPNPRNPKIIGIFVRYENLNADLKIQINTFLNHPLIS